VELQRGLYRRVEDRATRQEQLRILLQQFPVLLLMKRRQKHTADHRSTGWVRGRDFDRLIGAHAMSTTSILVTNNESDFRDIPAFKIENWTKD